MSSLGKKGCKICIFFLLNYKKNSKYCFFYFIITSLAENIICWFLYDLINLEKVTFIDLFIYYDGLNLNNIIKRMDH